MNIPKRTIQPATEPVTLSEVKSHLRVDISDDDTYLQTLIAAARTTCEDRCQRTLITTTWQYTLDEFPEAIPLPYPPIIGVTQLQYRRASDGVLVVLNSTEYKVDNVSQPGWVVPAYGKAWPDTYDEINTVIVTYTAGYGSASDVPAPIKHWILLAIGDMYDNGRGLSSDKATVPMQFADSLLDVYRFPGL